VNPRTLIRIALLIGVVAWFAYARFHAKPGPAAPAVMAAIPTNAKEFTLGTLHFVACELTQKRSGATTAAFCAPLRVPENYAEPLGRTIDLHLALIKADAEAADADFVVFLAGGPGQAAIENWPRIEQAFAPLRKHHHIVLLDQRGTGGSNALSCARAPDPDQPAEAALNDSVNLDEVRQQTRECLAQVEQHADPRFYTTTVAAQDLETVRQALGAPQFDLVGISYGTRMAQQYLMRNPDGVRSVVLDSVAPNEIVLGEDFAVNLENALKAQFSLCSKSPDCAKVFPDPYASLIRLRDALRARPQEFDFRDPITFAPAHKRLDGYALAGLVRLFAYAPETAALLPLSIAEGLKGNYTPLAGQAQLLTGDLSELRDNGMQTSVICAEDADLLTPRPQDADTVLGTALIDVIGAQCAIWPHGSRPPDFHAPLRSAKPILILEGELDPVTPPAYGEQVMKGLSNARLLVAKGQGHNVIGRGCIPRLVDDFVAGLEPRQLEAGCIDALGPVPAFIDFNGPSP
jgi:pimeloyl-ACP methyl ester carboxylesterase